MSFDLAAARDTLRGPGMDTRYWVRFGRILEINRDEYHVIVTAETLPTGEYVDAILAYVAQGSGKGLTWPVEVGNYVILMMADGDTEIANYAIGPVFFGDVKLPSEANNNPDRVEYSGHRIDIHEDTHIAGNVSLGGLDESDPAVKYNELSSALTGFVSAVNANFKAIKSALGIPLPEVALDITTAKSEKVRLK